MDDAAHPTQPPPQWLLDVIEESEADLAAGRVVPWADVRAEMTKIIAETKTEAATNKA